MRKLAASATGVSEDPQQFMPQTFEEAVNWLCNKVEPDTIRDPFFHFSGGMHTRNTLSLWDKESPLHKHMVERFGLCHADDMSMLISGAADAKKNGVEYDIDSDIERCKNHWINMGYDPKTMEKRSR